MRNARSLVAVERTSFTNEKSLVSFSCPKYRYKAMTKRVVDFSDDNKPLVMKEHKGGEM